MSDEQVMGKRAQLDNASSKYQVAEVHFTTGGKEMCAAKRNRTTVKEIEDDRS